MKNMTLRNIIKVTDGTFYGDESFLDKEIASITTDSRNAGSGSLFVAICGARSDGHDYIASVFEKGAMCAISQRKLPDCTYPYIVVKSSLEAIKAMAAFYRENLDIKVVGITGSVGKTSTKEMVASILAKKYKVLKTLGNFNNELGLPLTIFRLTEEDEVAVLEMGISDFGEMHRLSAIAKPDICIITNIGICHLENLGTRDGILKAKSEIFDYISKDGTIILNGADDKLSTITQVKGIKPLRFGGESSQSDAYATDVRKCGLLGTDCRITTANGTFETHIPIPGGHMVANALAGALCGVALGLTNEEIKSGIEELKPLTGRNNIVRTRDYTVIDDCYNANPLSMKASIDVLDMADTRKVAILGDMGELGTKEVMLHREIGEYAGKSSIDLLLCVGNLSTHMQEGFEKVTKSQAESKAGSKSRCKHFDTVEELLEKLPEYLKTDDSILVKASHFMKFEQIVEVLTK